MMSLYTIWNIVNLADGSLNATEYEEKLEKAL
jgi:hypothetical protein